MSAPVPTACTLPANHWIRALYNEITDPEIQADPYTYLIGNYLLQSTDGKLFCLHYSVFKCYSQVLTDHGNGLLRFLLLSFVYFLHSVLNN